MFKFEFHAQQPGSLENVISHFVSILSDSSNFFSTDKTAGAPSAATSFNDWNFGIDIALAVALVAVVFGGAAYCCIRVLGKAGESPQ